MQESKSKQNIIEASKDRNLIRNFLKKINLSQNLDVLKGLSKEERINRQIERIREAIEGEENNIEKKRLQNILNSFVAANETISEFLADRGKKEDEEDGIKAKGRIKKEIKKAKSESEKQKIKTQSESFGENKDIFLKAVNLIKEINNLELSLNKAHLEIVEGLPGSEEYFEDLRIELENKKTELNNLKENYFEEFRGAELLLLSGDLKKEGHIAKVDSVKEYIDQIQLRMLSGKPMFLHGPTGTGKTSLAKFAAKELTDKSAEIIYCNPQSRESSMYGKVGLIWNDNAAITKFIYGPISRALKEGKVIIFDEFSSLPKEQMAMIKGLMNNKVGDKVSIPDNGEIIMKQGFQIICTANLKSDKNKERNDLPPEVANEFAQNNLEINYTKKEEAFDIFLTRLMNQNQEINFSKSDLEKGGIVSKFLEAMEEIQNAYIGRELIDGTNKDASGKVSLLKKLVMNQRTIENILSSWFTLSKRNKELSFLEFLDQRLKTELNFGEYKEDKLLAAKILISKGLLSTISAEELGLTESDLSVGNRGEQRKKENLEAEINKSRNREILNLKEIADLDPFELKNKKGSNNLNFVNEETGEVVKIVGAKIQTPENFSTLDLEKLSEKLTLENSKWSIDKSIEGGQFNVILDQKDLEDLSTKEKAIKRFEEESKKSGSDFFIVKSFKKLLSWDDILNPNLNPIIINAEQTTLAERRSLVEKMDVLGYRPLTVSELTGVAFKRDDFYKKYQNPIFNSLHNISSASLSPCFFWNVEWWLRALDASDDWNDRNRFLFVRK